jgi:hypothetical protein
VEKPVGADRRVGPRATDRLCSSRRSAARRCKGRRQRRASEFDWSALCRKCEVLWPWHRTAIVRRDALRNMFMLSTLTDQGLIGSRTQSQGHCERGGAP